MSSNGLIIHSLGIEATAWDDRTSATLYLKISLPENDVKPRYPLFNGLNPQVISTPIVYPIPLPFSIDPKIHPYLLDVPVSSNSSSTSATRKPEVVIAPNGNISISQSIKSGRKSGANERSQWLVILAVQVELAVDDHEPLSRWMTIIPIPPCLNNKIRFRVAQHNTDGEAEISAQPKIYPSKASSVDDALWLQGSFQSTNEIRLEWSFPPADPAYLARNSTEESEEFADNSNRDDSFQTVRASPPSHTYPPSNRKPSPSNQFTGLRNQPPPGDMTMEEYSFEMASGEIEGGYDSPLSRLNRDRVGHTPSPLSKGLGREKESSDLRKRLVHEAKNGSPALAATGFPSSHSKHGPVDLTTSTSTSTSASILSSSNSNSTTSSGLHHTLNFLRDSADLASQPQTSGTGRAHPAKSKRPYLLNWSSFVLLSGLLVILLTAREIQRIRFEQYKVMMEVRDLRGVLDAVLSSNEGRGDAGRFDGSRSGHSHVENEVWHDGRGLSSRMEHESGQMGGYDVEGAINDPGQDNRIIGYEHDYPQGVDRPMGETEADRTFNAVGRVVVKHQWEQWLNHPTVQTLRGGFEWVWKALRFALIGE